MARLNGKRAIVLGAAGAGNLGQVTARRFAAEGARVLVAGRHEAPLRALAEEIGGTWAMCDITREADLAQMVDTCCDAFGGVDLAVNATGWGLLTPFLDTSREELERMCAVQFTGPCQFFQAVLRRMADGGSLVQVSSATARIMMEDHAAYMGTKAGIDHVIRCIANEFGTRGIANEFGTRGIRANSVAPGFTASPMTARAARNPAVVGAFAKEYPLGRVGTLEDTAEAITWLCTDACFLTGECLQVNGGLTLRRNPTNAEIVAAAKAAKAAREAAQDGPV